ncbi:MAG: hypothetical protein ACI4S4_07315 [Candidatus Ornithospirochaeta sp.]
MDKVYMSSRPVDSEEAEIAVPYLKGEVWKELDEEDGDRIFSFMKEMESEEPDVFIAVFANSCVIDRMLSFVTGEEVTMENLVLLFSFRCGRWTREDVYTF